MIKIHDLNFKIGQAQILNGISTEIPKGKLTALIGPNGAGKSSLLKLIARLEKLQSGRVEIDGLDLATTPTEALALKMAVLSQQTVIASRLRLAELVGFGRWPHHHGRPGAKDRAQIDLALETFGLTSLAGRFLDEVSGGQAQRAFLAMTFAQETDWLLLDEPLNNLDMAHSRALMQRLHALVQDSGKSIVVVIHEVNYAAAWADHIIAMKNGAILAEGTAHQVLCEETLSDLYDVPIAISQHQGRPLVLHHV